MSPIRPAVALLVIMALLITAGAASAAVSTLTPNPPVALPSAPPAPAPKPDRAIARRAAVRIVPPAAGTIPRTGIDVGLEALFGSLLIATGALLRARHPDTRSLASGYVELEPVPVGQRR